MTAASGPGVIRLRKVRTLLEQETVKASAVSRLCFSVREAVSQLNTTLSPQTGALQRRINETCNTWGASRSPGFFLCGAVTGSGCRWCVSPGTHGQWGRGWKSVSAGIIFFF